MPFAKTDDGVKLYYEETGDGAPIVFVHEFAADHRSWEMQMRHFGQRYRCITFSARGYPPSDVPEKPESYSQNRATDDILAVMDHLKIDKADPADQNNGWYLRGVGRLKPGVTLAQSNSDVGRVQDHLDQTYPDQDRGLATAVLPLKQLIVGDVGGTLLLLNHLSK